MSSEPAASTSAAMNGDSTSTTDPQDSEVPDPLLELPSDVVREGDFVVLIFGDGRQTFAHCLKSWRGKSPPLKINKKSYPTANLIGLSYGTVLELGLSGLIPLPHGEEVIPKRLVTSSDKNNATASGNTSDAKSNNGEDDDDEDGGNVTGEDDTTFPPLEQANDNRHLVDNNKSQSMQQDELMRLRRLGTDGSAIVNKLIENSSTFENKTEFSKAKYVLKKQKKHQPRCRIVRCTSLTICETIFLRDPRKLMNMREDTLGQILSYSNISAGCQTLVFETCNGVVTGALAERLGGYGKVMSVYSGQQPSFSEMLLKFNLSFAETHSIKWVHSGDVFGEDVVTSNDPEASDPERVEREQLEWPCPLQDHTRKYLEGMGPGREQADFLSKRCSRFARKLTRHTPMEGKEWLTKRKCDSVIIAARYDPTATLMGLLPYLAPSCPFVVYCEFIEPLTDCFREIQKQNLAINLRLSDTWMREYQVLPGRTHPNMSISQSGGFILTGIKLCPETGHNELDDALIKEIREKIGGRRGKKKGKPGDKNDSGSNKKRKASNNRDDAKRPRNEST